MKNSVNGWLVLDKPLGMSSAKLVAIVKRITGADKAGHAGTLDPLASGALPIALGQATKVMQYVLTQNKSYEFTITFGQMRDTGDAEGEVTGTSEVRPTRPAIIKALEHFTGQILQAPPIYSAIKVKGRAAYSYARAGKTLALPERLVMIQQIRLVSLAEDLSEASFAVDCGTGTYIRSIARDLSLLLGTCGYVSYLRRTKLGNFDVHTAISLDSLEEMVQSVGLGSHLLSIDKMLDDIPVLEVDDDASINIRHGRATQLQAGFAEHAVVLALCRGEMIAIGKSENGYFMPKKVFNN
jgi:tRNA pseudouridine55 synthase